MHKLSFMLSTENIICIGEHIFIKCTHFDDFVTNDWNTEVLKYTFSETIFTGITFILHA